MSQPGNYRYQSYDQSNNLKSGIPPMVNGQPGAMQQPQNGLQPSNFNTTGTPSSQSSRDPSREPSRDPSPTQYLHNQYRPQLTRPPMPTINGQQAPPPPSMSQQTGPIQPPQSSPHSNPNAASNQFSNVQTSGVPSFPTQTMPPFSNANQGDSQPSQAPKQMPMRYDFSSPNRNVPSMPGSQTSIDSQVRPKLPPQSYAPMMAGSQTSVDSLARPNLPPQPYQQMPGPNVQSTPSTMPPLNAQANWNKEQTTNQPLNTARPTTSQAYSSQMPPSVGQMSRSKETISTQPSSINPSPSPLVSSSQTWKNPAADSHSDSQGSQAYSSNIFHQNAPPRTQPATSQNLGFAQPPVSSMAPTSYPQQSLGKPNTTNPNLRGPPPIGAQATPPMPGINTSMQNVFGGQTSNQNSVSTSQVTSQNLSGPPISQHSTLPKQPAQYPEHPAIAVPRTNQPNQGGYGNQQNVASQWKHPGYPSQPPTGPSIPGQNVSCAPPPLPGQIPVRPPPTSGQPLPGQQQQPEAPYDFRAPYFGQPAPLDNMNKRYPNTAYPDKMNQLNTQMGNLNVTQSGFNEMWGQQSIDLLQCRNVLPSEKVEPPKIKLHQEFLDNVNCSPEIFRCTLTKIPESNSLLQKCRLPLGVLIHPFKDLNHLPVIQCSTIVRCRACRTYINPFVYFVDSKRWKCNLCYRVNELPEEFQFDPVTKSYGDPSRRPEVKTSTIEFIAPSEYMLRPPQPAVYLFVLDVSRLAVESGYLSVACEVIADELTKLPGDGRTQVGFMAVDSAVHFFNMPENVSQPHELIMLDVDDVFLPCPDNLIVNLKEREELVRDLLEQLPVKFNGTFDTNCAIGAGLQAAYKLMSATGGRVTVFQTCLPNLGPGALQPREDPNTRASKDVPHLNPATDFYKRLALDCSGQQIAVDLFLLNSQYSDLATLSGMCKFSGGCIYHIPLFRRNKPQHSETLEKMLRRYLTRKIGFEAVMRIRCTRGLSIHTFHGNFFVRSTDLLSLPNVNPDAGFGMQVSIEENLSDVQSVCFQAALLYTSSKGERRIRVHTLCLPVSASITDVLYSADQQAIVGLLGKMAVDRSQQSSLSDARDALINVAIDVLSAYKMLQSSLAGGLSAPTNLKLLPLYIIALIKSMAFRSGTSTRLDDRIFAMCQMKTLPLGQLMQFVYPDLYPVHALDDRNSKDIDGKICPQPPRLHLSAEKLDFRGVFLMDAGDRIFLYVGKSVDPTFCTNVFGVPAYASIPEEFYDLPELDTAESERLRNFVFSLQEEKPYYAPVQIIRDDSHFRGLFTERLIEDRVEHALSYYEFLQHLKTQVK